MFLRKPAAIPIAFSGASLVLAFLCLFAGSKQNFMEDYSVVTLNTSRIGQQLFNTTESSDNPFLNLIDNVTNSIESEIQDQVSSFAKDLGLHDFYSVHLMNYCEGYYTPSAVPNDTISRSDISKNVTACANRTALFNFNPQQILQRELNESGHSDIDLADLQWPDSVDKGFNALRVTAKAMFVIYCIAIGFIALALVAAIAGLFLEGTLAVVFNVIVYWLAFIAIGIASAMATAIGVKGASVINKYGNDIGIAANKGTKFLILTWVATGLMIIATFVWCFAIFSSWKARRFRYNPKNG